MRGPRKKTAVSGQSTVGVLVLHGFTSDLRAVDQLKPHLKEKGWFFSFPVLRGHGGSPWDLCGVRARDWYQDAEEALFELSKKTEKRFVVGLSMGGLLALELGIKHPEKIDGAILVAPALKPLHPLARFARWLQWLIPLWPSPGSILDPACAEKSKNYKWFPTAAFASLYDYSKWIETRASEFKRPVLIIKSEKDQVIDPASADRLYETIGSKQKKRVCFQNSGHDMMQDGEAEAIFREIIQFIHETAEDN